MKSRKLARRYATALGELAVERGHLDEVERDLRAVRQVLGEEVAFRRVIESENVTQEEKLRIVREALEGRVSPLSLNFLLLVVSKRREAALIDMLDEFFAYADEKRGVVEVEVTAARPLSGEESQAIQEKLSHVIGKAVRLTTREDGDLIGGIVARIGDLVMDGSVRSRLARLGEQLKRAQLN